MYKFTNGVVVYDKETRDKYIKAGMTLVKESKPEEKEEQKIAKEEELQSSPKRNEFRSTRKRTDRFGKGIR